MQFINQQIHYYSHIFLNSKYRIFINLFIILNFYSLCYVNNIIFCMNESTNSIEIPEIAETKQEIPINNEIIDLRRNIHSYAGNIISQLEEKDQIINSMDRTISLMKEEIVQLKERQSQDALLMRDLLWKDRELKNACYRLEDEIISHKAQIIKLDRELNGFYDTGSGGIHFTFGLKDRHEHMLGRYNEGLQEIKQLKENLQLERNKVKFLIELPQESAEPRTLQRRNSF